MDRIPVDQTQIIIPVILFGLIYIIIMLRLIVYFDLAYN